MAENVEDAPALVARVRLLGLVRTLVAAQLHLVRELLVTQDASVMRICKFVWDFDYNFLHRLVCKSMHRSGILQACDLASVIIISSVFYG